MSDLTKDQAIALAETKWWEGKSAYEICLFQMFENRLCMPFPLFHKAVEEALGRSVWTHEFGLNHAGLQKELLGEQSPPSLAQIMEMIPESKRIIVVVP